MSKLVKILVSNNFHRFAGYVSMCGLVNTWREFNPFCAKVDKTNRYWVLQTPAEVIEEADKQFEDNQFLDVYELLNRLKYCSNVEVHWRIARALFKMASDETQSKMVRREMVLEAHDLIQFSLKIGNSNPNVHKWLAIVADAKNGWEGTDSRVRGFNVVKRHMIKAVELNPNDVVVLYMLGKLCYAMSHLTWFQRLLARILYATAPSSSYEEAYSYFFRAEQISPRFYLPNLYMLGKTCYRMKQYYRARYYLAIAASIPARTVYEKECSQKAKKLAESLHSYDLHLDALAAQLPKECPIPNLA